MDLTKWLLSTSSIIFSWGALHLKYKYYGLILLKYYIRSCLKVFEIFNEIFI